MIKSAPEDRHDEFQTKVLQEWGRMARDDGAVVTFDWDVISDGLSLNEARQALFGFSDDRVKTMAEFMACLGRVDSGLLENNLNRILAGETSGIEEFRIHTPMGPIIDIGGSASVVMDADGHRHIVGLLTDRSRKNQRAEEKLKGGQEKSHQIKNILSVVSGIASMTQRTQRSPDDLVSSLNSRLQALAKSADLVAESTNGFFSLTVFVASVAGAFAGGRKINVKSCGYGIDTDACQMLAVAIHELTSNALRHGALSALEGDVSVSLNVQKDGSLDFVWQERSPGFVEPVEPRQGFGWQILTRAMAREFSTQPAISWTNEGIIYTFTIASDKLIRLGDRVPNDR